MQTQKQKAKANQVLANATLRHDTAAPHIKELHQTVKREVSSVHAITHAAFFYVQHNPEIGESHKYFINELFQTLLQHEVELFDALSELKITN